jgi:hypothetical protein
MLGYDPDQDVKLTGQPYLFDSSANELTIESFMAKLPERLFGFKDGITFADFFSRLTNETPATSEIMKAGLAIMVNEGAINVRDNTGWYSSYDGRYYAIHATTVVLVGMCVTTRLLTIQLPPFEYAIRHRV